MCGITGILGFTEQGQKKTSFVKNAVARLNKRGPDASGIYEDKNIALGHARLSIIDTTSAASQPFTDSTGRYTIIFNGEFYNFKEYRKQLLDKGYSLSSTGDTEVLLYMLIYRGTDFIKEINGFFAFAFYDKKEKTLLLARDRYGIKPLVYYQCEDYFAFASEMKALLEYQIPKEIDTASLLSYLQLNYIPAPHSIFNDVSKLEPGTFLEISQKSTVSSRQLAVVTHKSYYQVQTNSEIADTPDNYQQSKTKLRNLVFDAVEKRMVSDVPLGAFLSGGIDSSIIVAAASTFKSDLSTFSIGYKDEPMFDETEYAELVAKKYHTNHTSFKLTNNELFEQLHSTLDYIDEPFADSSALAVNILCNYTRKHATVMLSGDGADEIFAGYNKHQAEYMLRNSPFQTSVIKLISPLIAFLPQSRNSPVSNIVRQLNRYAIGTKLSDSERYWRWCSFINETQAMAILDKQFSQTDYDSRKHKLMKHFTPNGSINEVLHTDIDLVLQSDMLVKIDMMSMNQSLELRNPFLDYRIIDFSFTLPSTFKINKNGRKLILKEAFDKELPSEILNRKKHGFEVPLLKWFKTELKSLITDELLSEPLIKEQGIFNSKEIEKIKAKLFSQNPEESSAQVWGLIVFQYWWKKYFCK